MTKRDFAKEDLRRKRALIATAETEIPQTWKANYRGSCGSCKKPIKRGAQIARHPDGGYRHAGCEGNDVHERLAARRATLQAARGAAPT